MAPKFHVSSFEFEEGQSVPAHDEVIGLSSLTPDSSKWHLMGQDGFDYETYPLAYDIDDLETAQLLMSARRRELERTQPTGSSGGSGFGGIQDRVEIIHPRTPPQLFPNMARS